MTILASARLRYEPLAERHFAGLHAMNSDPHVMLHLGGQPETPDQTRASIARAGARWAEWGYGWWALLDPDSGALVGAAAIQHLDKIRANPHELGWRLRRADWGRGLASEAARTLAAYAFETLGAPRLCAVRAPANLASQRVMERLGMGYVGLTRADGVEVALHELARAEWEARRG